MTEALRSWCEAISRTANGRIALSNLLHDCVEQRIPHDVLIEFLNIVCAAWATPIPGHAPESMIREIARRNPDRFFCQGTPALSSEPCSRILPAKDLLRENIAYERMGWSDCPDFVPDEYLEELESGLDGKVCGDIPDGRPFAWVTKTTDLDQLTKEPAPDRATQVRDALGLIHYFGEVQLVAVNYPAAPFAADRHLSPPTFLDGSPYVVFRCRKAADGWGQTLHLVDGGNGLPEAVHPPIAFSGSFSVRRLGYTTSVAWRIDFEAVWKNADHPWDETQIDRLINLLSYESL